MCWMQSSATLINRTPSVTGGSQLGSITRSRSDGVSVPSSLPRAGVDRVEVLQQRLNAVRPDGADLVDRVAVAVIVRVGFQSEPRRPVTVLPQLPVANQPRQLGVLHASDVPDQPRDRIPIPSWLREELLGVETVDNFSDQRRDAAVDVEQQFGHVHGGHSITAQVAAERRMGC